MCRTISSTFFVVNELASVWSPNCDSGLGSAAENSIPNVDVGDLGLSLLELVGSSGSDVDDDDVPSVLFVMTMLGANRD